MANNEISAFDFFGDELEIVDAKARNDIKTLNTQYKDIAYKVNDILERLGILENYHKTKIYNIPRLNLSGDIFGISATNKATLDCELLDVYGKPIISDKKCTLKYQGNSSLGWTKKNFAISFLESDGVTKYKHKFFEDVSKNDGYHLKSDWEDAIRMKNIVTANIAEKMYSKKLPTGGRSTMEGFEVQIYINDAYQGLYSFNTKQHKTVYKFDDTNVNHLMYRANGASASTCRFKALSIDNSEDISNDWEDRYPGTNTVENRAKLNRVIQWVIDCENDVEKFKTELSKYFDKEYLLKYTILAYIGGMWDNIANNFNLITYDGLIWYPTFYDMDSTWGYHYSTCPISTSYAFPTDYTGGDSLLFTLVMSAFKDTDLKNYYSELRNNVLSYDNIVAEFDKKLAEMTQEELTKDLNKWSAGKIDYNLTETKKWINSRLTYVDSQILGTTPVAVEGITLSEKTITLAKGDTKQLAYTLNPSNATNKTVIWSTNNGNCTVTNGLVNAVNEGECVIAVTSNDTTNGTITDTCTVTVTAQSIAQPVLLCELQGNNHGDVETTWKDVSGNNNDATLVNVTQNGTTSGWANNKLVLNGTNGYVRLNTSLEKELDFTVEFKAKITKASVKTIFAKRTKWDGEIVADLYCSEIDGKLFRIETTNQYNFGDTDSMSFDWDNENIIKLHINTSTSTIKVNINGITELINDITYTYPNSTSALTFGNSLDDTSESATMAIDYIKFYKGDAIS